MTRVASLENLACLGSLSEYRHSLEDLVAPNDMEQRASKVEWDKVLVNLPGLLVEFVGIAGNFLVRGGGPGECCEEERQSGQGRTAEKPGGSADGLGFVRIQR